MLKEQTESIGKKKNRAEEIKDIKEEVSINVDKHKKEIKIIPDKPTLPELLPVKEHKLEPLPELKPLKESKLKFLPELKPSKEHKPEPLPELKPLESKSKFDLFPSFNFFKRNEPEKLPELKPKKSKPEPLPELKPLKEFKPKLIPQIKPSREHKPEPLPELKPLKESKPKSLPELKPLKESKPKSLPELKPSVPRIVIPHLSRKGHQQKKLHDFNFSKQDSLLPEMPPMKEIILDELFETSSRDDSALQPVYDAKPTPHEKKSKILAKKSLVRVPEEKLKNPSLTHEESESLDKRIKESFFNLKKRISNRLALEMPHTFYKKVKEGVISKVEAPHEEEKLSQEDLNKIPDNFEEENEPRFENILLQKVIAAEENEEIIEKAKYSEKISSAVLKKEPPVKKLRVPKKKYFESGDFSLAVSHLSELRSIISHDFRYLVNDLQKKKEMHEQEVVKLKDKTEQIKNKLKVFSKIIPIKIETSAE
jgi:hypothetical protein